MQLNFSMEKKTEQIHFRCEPSFKKSLLECYLDDCKKFFKVNGKRRSLTEFIKSVLRERFK